MISVGLPERCWLPHLEKEEEEKEALPSQGEHVLP